MTYSERQGAPWVELTSSAPAACPKSSLFLRTSGLSPGAVDLKQPSAGQGELDAARLERECQRKILARHDERLREAQNSDFSARIIRHQARNGSYGIPGETRMA